MNKVQRNFASHQAKELWLKVLTLGTLIRNPQINGSKMCQHEQTKLLARGSLVATRF